MNKLILILLLLPVTVLGQLTSSGDGIDIDLVYSGTTADANKPLTNVQVNDTIVLKLNLSNLSSNTITYVHVDLQYNTNAWARVDYSFDVPTGAQTSNSNWSGNGQKWTVNSNYDANDLWAQWSTQGGAYTQVAGWEVDHVEAISTSGISGNYATLKFLAKDAGDSLSSQLDVKSERAMNLQRLHGPQTFKTFLSLRISTGPPRGCG